jgi:hypothetical protein
MPNFLRKPSLYPLSYGGVLRAILGQPFRRRKSAAPPNRGDLFLDRPRNPPVDSSCRRAAFAQLPGSPLSESLPRDVMSFRFFIYYCAMCGAGGGFVGWLIGRFLVWIITLILGHEPSTIISDGIKAMFVGMVVAAALSLVDALWVFSLRQFPSIALRVGTAVFIGTLGGLFGGLVPTTLSEMVREALVGALKGTDPMPMSDRIIYLMLILLGWFKELITWTITGTLIGISVGTFDVVANVLRGRDFGGAVRKTFKGLIGGAVGGLIGGVFSLVLHGVMGMLFQHKRQGDLWLPSSSGFIILGMSIGLMIGLAQIILKEAWLRVEQGFRRGREMMLQKSEITIGRAESCDVGLFGDPLVDKLHAKLMLHGNQYFVVDAGSASGTFVNDQRINGPTPLRNGDAIRLGKCVLRFGERAKRQ